MVFRHGFIASSLIVFFAFGCSNGANSSTENTTQFVQKSNVTQLLVEAKATQNAEVFLTQGNNLLDNQRYQDAIKAYDKAIAMKAEIVEAWINRGIALTSLHRYKDAVASYDRAIAIKPDKDEAWYNRGIALTSLQRYQDAVASYNQALSIKPNKYEALTNRGIALTKLKRYQDAIASYNQAIAIKQDLHQAYYNKACSYALQGDVKLATENLDRAIQLVPEKYKNLAKTDPDFNKVRSQKRFQELLQ
ncbi:tetratricopeptide repeat protein [Nostoc sp. PA-18-2419]|uniref:tetratricopeptide repeat protein n=1 Tax=Nostoc sp. PA-18-2419 TaxID=2575443 RepID=UPI00110888D9|nr:tetratricopeptide repeat protein [Nostoc sp. PA-18-2419]